ncbi:hypothetical protein LTR56_018782 [Elasticomyces elasticus]|nr:hypothetical protein LTR56_018782 [Elasticomyces elasticus]KAK3635761.1 hypothetical protein LTR22_019041 [Elasticomyces elasticus]KAK4911920.1 hypothetical protein LTR49_019567 [Elasticomyces elasticus]KAK5743041.1 hypothetical protein LTS12_023997 [Elasticomyces elasticus]
MVLGDANVSWPEVKKLCTAADIDRLACLAVAAINSGSMDQASYTKAANQFGGGIKPDSYKRGLWVISKRIKDAQAKSNGASPTPSPTKGTPKGGKRKAAATANADQDDDEVETPKTNKKAKALKKEAVADGVAHSPAQQGAAPDELDDYFK